MVESIVIFIKMRDVLIFVVWYLISTFFLFNIAECLFHGAVDVVSNICYGKQRCSFTVDEEHFKNPCPPGTKKYITVLYACGMNALISIEIFPKQNLFECVFNCLESSDYCHGMADL